jgi:mono/diheme cytochrome c family protein
MPIVRSSVLIVFALLLASSAVRGQGAVSFTRDIRPILADNCFACHGPDEKQRKAKLRLDTRQGAFAKRDGEAVIAPGKSDKSELFHRLSATEANEVMPPPRTNRKLTAAQIDLVRRWIDQGAVWSDHWAFTPPRRPPVPEVRNAKEAIRNDVDRFILARLEKEGLKPSAEASRETLLRRVSLDLTGLPPSLRDLTEFLADASPDAYEKAVDRLLKSPRYGERMALDWLDAARYADSNGYQSDGTRTMWPWRDYLIAALNKNTPFDQLTIELLAGDLLLNASREQKVATGFHRNHMLNGEGGRIAEESRIDYVVDRVDTTAALWMGLTLGCARCHDHKFDPFTQKDYYSLFAYWNSINESGAVDRGGNANPVLTLSGPDEIAKQKEIADKIADLDKQLKTVVAKHLAGQGEWEARLAADPAKLPPPIAGILKTPADKRTDAQKKQLADHYLTTSAERTGVQTKLDEARKALDAHNRSLVQVMVMEEQAQPRPTHILIRGAYDKPGDKVSPNVITSLLPPPTGAPANRLGLARWLASPEHPLTARVAVNRAWQQFFGTGLVRTSEDFGFQGEPPSHPELLDYLATEFVRTGWDTKALHRLIVTSATYRQSSKVTPEQLERDPANRLLARGARGRLSSLVIRDQALFLSGLLVEKIGGPPVRPYQPPGVWEEMTFGKIGYRQDKGENLYRRSLYTFWRRTVGPTSLFDTPARQICTVRQPRTNTPLHALILLNDVTYVEAARVLAERLLTQGGATPEERIITLFRMATARSPRDAERLILIRSLERFRKQYQADKEGALKLVSVGEAPRDEKLDVVELAAYTGLASVVLNLDEVISKE